MQREMVCSERREKGERKERERRERERGRAVKEDATNNDEKENHVLPSQRFLQVHFF